MANAYRRSARNVLRRPLLALTFLVPFALTACGQGTTDEEDDPSAAEDGQTEAPAEDVPEADEDESGAEPAEDESVDLPDEIELLVGVGAGGGYDTWARQVGSYMEEYLPGNPTVSVQNVTGAGGGVMLNQLYSAEPDGATFAITNLISLALYDVTEALPIEPTTFTAIGQVSDEKKHLFVGPESEYTSVESLEGADEPVLAALVGLAGGGGVTTIAFFDELGVPWQPVTHDGSSEAVLSVVRGDTDVIFVSADSVAGYVEDGDLVPIFYTGTEAPTGTAAELEVMSGVETAGDLGLEDFSLVSSEARTFIAPPGMSEDVQSAFERALEETTSDPDFVTWLEEANNSLQLLSSAETADKLEDAATATERYEDALMEYLG